MWNDLLMISMSHGALRSAPERYYHKIALARCVGSLTLALRFVYHRHGPGVPEILRGERSPMDLHGPSMRDVEESRLGRRGGASPNVLAASLILVDMIRERIARSARHARP
ncbi:MAG: hypothetical protein IJR14_05725 [Synergistaceae bacterium]|nr:hypothetical protein [Synergistaceae bacterium]